MHLNDVKLALAAGTVIQEGPIFASNAAVQPLCFLVHSGCRQGQFRSFSSIFAFAPGVVASVHLTVVRHALSSWEVFDVFSFVLE